MAATVLPILVLPSLALAATDQASPPSRTAPDPAAPASVATPAKPPAPEASDVIIVTGSRIAQSPIRSTPITSIGSDELAHFGATNVGQELTTLPAFGVPANGPVGSQGSFSAGQTFVNLYDLGAQRTLTLIDGNRFVTSANASIFGPVQGSPVDLGQVAPGLVDRIDVVSVGGAPIYGSDAIAGTINIVLKHDYDGLEIESSAATSSHGDARDYNVSLLTGRNFAGGRGNITLDVYYDHQNGLRAADRLITGASAPFFGQPAGTDGSTYKLYPCCFRYPVFANTGIPLTSDSIPFYKGVPIPGGAPTNAAGQGLFFNKAGQLVPFNNGTPLFNGITEAGGDGFAIGDYGNLLTKSDRVQAVALGHFDISDHVRVHGEFWLGHTVATSLTGQPYYSTNLFGPAGTPNGNLAFSTTNPFLSAGDAATINAAVNALNGTNLASNTFYLARANTDLESGTFRSVSDLLRIVGGIDGDLTTGRHKLTWEVTLNYGQVISKTTQRELVTQNFFNALDAVSVNGSIQCAPGYTSSTAQTISSTCAPLDVFGLGNASQAAIDYVTSIAQTYVINTQFDGVADLKGDVLDLPAGKVNAVLGYEHRRESARFDPGAFYRGQRNADGSYTQYGNSIPITPVGGYYHTNELFGELTVPLVSPAMRVPLLHSLDVDGAARYTNHDITGGFWSYTAGGTWAPFGGLTVRGNFTRSFRSPSLTELGAPEGSSFETANDPCDAGYIKGGPNPAQRAKNCAAAGITQPFSSNVVNYTVLGQSGGNANLKNELANSWTIGAVIRPSFAKHASLVLDYVNIDIKNEITSPGLTNEMAACYDSSDFPTNLYCSTFQRDSHGQVVSFTDNYSNIAIESFRALQGTFNYQAPLSDLGLSDRAGTLTFKLNLLHTYRHYTKTGSADRNLVLNSATDPVDNLSGSLDWERGKLDWAWQFTYYGPSHVNANVPLSTYDYPRISPYLEFNSSIDVQFNRHFDARLLIKNVFNTHVPFPYYVSDNRYYDAIIGRYFRLSVGYKL